MVFVSNPVHCLSNALLLCRQFLKSPNFDGWFRNRRKEMMQKLEALHLEALCEEVSMRNHSLLNVQKMFSNTCVAKARSYTQPICKDH